MSPSLLSPPDRRSLLYEGGAPPRSGGPGPQAPPTGPGRRRPPLAVLLSVTALLGGASGAAVIAATGVGGGDRAPASATPTPTTSAVSTTGATGGSLDAEALFARASAGVVDISVTGASSGARGPLGAVPPQGTTGSGTGFVIDEDGLVLTAAHVVDGAPSVSVRFADGTSRKATVLGRDDATDVALLRVDPAGLDLRPLALGSSASLDVGDDIAVIGGPFGYERSLSTGVVSGVDRTIEAPNGFTVAHAIQTDAAMNPGNSGGPVLDAAGRVVGIASQIATGGAEQSAGVGFAVPIDRVRAALEQLEAGEDVRHAHLGAALADGAAGTPGAAIGAVTPGGPAADDGLRAGDVVTRFAGERITGVNDLVAAVAGHDPGDEVRLTVRRGGEDREVTVTLGEQPAQSRARP